MKKLLVISLGGSLIIPDNFDSNFLSGFVRVLRKNFKTHRFVVVCGGGSVARKYISALRGEGRSKDELALAGIRATRMNARFVMQMFDKKEVNDSLPKSMKQVKDNLRKNDVVVCGALRFSANSTTDTTSAKLAKYLGTDFVNLTNVKGLYDKNPKKYKNAKFISEIDWKDFEKMALSMKFKAGQNFVLDQQAAVLIRKNKIKTFIVSGDLKNLESLIKCKGFVGTQIGR
ncbi:MAG: UMP kinase [Nanoarchaeota archaeon]|nr:UMP kinase [Nanoarchaeota archaeon]